MKKGWTEDESTDVRTRDLARRQRNIYNGEKPWRGAVKEVNAYPSHIGKPFVPTLPPADPRLIYGDDIPRRTDWHRVAQGTVVLIALAAASAALIVAGAMLIRSVWT